jgi:endo-1,4-beta-D-glucanase Y
MPGYYTVFYHLTQDPYYEEAAQAARVFLKAVANPSTGLLPVRATFRGEATGEWGAFAPEAYRALLNLVIDRLWGTSDEWQVDQIDDLLTFFNDAGVNSSNVALYGSAYSLNGKEVYIEDHRVELVLVNGVIAMLSNLPSSAKRPFIEAAAAVPIPTGSTRYYPGILYLLCNLIMAGEFRLCWGS